MICSLKELVRQGEQLNNVEQKLDQVNQDMKTTQKHLNNIKSVFGGIKNWWSGKKEAQAVEKRSRESTLQENISGQPPASSADHPALRVRKEDSFTHQEAAASRGAHWDQYEKQFNQNLGKSIKI